MPPFGFRKRERSLSPPATPSSTKSLKKTTPGRSKPTLFEAIDAPVRNGDSIEDNKRFLDSLHKTEDGDDDDVSSLSEADSDEFEDVPPAKRRKTSPVRNGAGSAEEDEEDGMDWEDAIQEDGQTTQPHPAAKSADDIADVSISVNEDGSYVEPLVSAGTNKKGPSKRERQIRIQTHCLHVQSLMWHNTVRNSWANDAEVQEILVQGMPTSLRKEIQRWKVAMGMPSREELEAKKQATAKSKGKTTKGKQKGTGRDWSYEAAHAEQGNINMSGGDPLLRLLKVLTAYWRKRFTTTAPCLRKQGYKPLRQLRDDLRVWERNRRDPEESGERVENLAEFRKLAKDCEGSRDIGAQLFVALLRGVGLDTRLVANLQPIGFGWSKSEEADAKKTTRKETRQPEEDSASDTVEIHSAPQTPRSSKAAKNQNSLAGRSARTALRGDKADPINLDDSDSELSDAPIEIKNALAREEGDDEDSVVEVMPTPPAKKKPSKRFDRDLSFPNYWAEVCSPATHKYYPVDPIVLSTIASSDELLQTFEPRGKPAEKSKQVICYTIGFSSDGTAKDVTVRYLKKHQLPGKTKGMRMPAEKIPIYNHKGKVRRYEEYDWFRTVMSLYDRPEQKRTAADDLEEQTDLKPFKAINDKKEVDKESLQWYKQSAEFVLEQFLRREEALRPGSNPVKTFTAGKGDKAKDHPVYRRADVLTCKTVESWHKEGRAIKLGEQPLKYVPMRAVTLIRKREMEDAQRETGEKLKQGLYSVDQTDWIIPPPIEDGVIPKNAFGNMDVYVPTMVPSGAVHLPLKGSAKLCKRLGIDFAEACTGFEFGKQRAVPVLTGVVVAEENERLVRDAWRADREEQKRKQDTKRSAIALRWWRKMVLGLRVLERMRIEFAEKGGAEEEVNPFVAKAQREGRMQAGSASVDVDHEGGGFLLSEPQDAEHGTMGHADDAESNAGGFVVDTNDDGGGGGFLLEEDEADEGMMTESTPFTPVSLQSMHKDSHKSPIVSDTKFKRPNGSGKPARGKRPSQPTGRRKQASTVEEDAESSSLSSVSGVDDSATDQGSEIDSETSYRRSNQPLGEKISSPGRPKRRANAKPRSTPRKSKYFDHSDGSEDDSAESEGDKEVVKPRRTTARTRRKR